MNTAHVPWEAPAMLKGNSPVGPYGDMVLLADWCVGRVLDALERQGILDNTLVIFDLENDPAEQHDLMDTLPEKAAVMRAALNRLMTEASSRQGLESRPVESEEPFKCESQ